MHISVIIPSYNGALHLPLTLNSLQKQSLDDFEIVVVLDGSTDNSEEVLKKIEFENLIVVNQKNKGRSGARNTGAKYALGDLLIFIDDDIQASPNLLECHHKFHSDNNGILVGNIIEDNFETDFQCFKSHLNRKWMNALGSELQKLDHPFITAANFSIPRSTFKKLNGFDEKINDCEDYDLALKASENSIPIFFNPQCIAHHTDHVTCKSYIKRLREYHSALLRLEKLYPQRYANHSNHIKHTIPKTIVFGVFNHKIWEKIIDKNLLKTLPTKMRFKLYDWVITARAYYFNSDDR